MTQNAYHVYYKLWQDRMLTRFPEAYKKFYTEWKLEEPSPVHYIPKEGKWERNDYGQIIPIQNMPIKVKYPYESHDGIWGGEGVLQGFTQPYKWRGRQTRLWFPNLYRSVVYSEILDKYLSVIVTETTKKKIHEHFGFDTYILKSRACDLQSLLACALKQTLLLTLIDNLMYPEDTEKQKKIYEKYKTYIIPREEVEWYGLSLHEAGLKLIRENEKLKITQPLKQQFRRETYEYLKSQDEAKHKNSMMSRLFQKAGKV